jgi:wyosine [tRNA(Phe)-imidazoG37] synthetase (radical SAM superfamily)
MGFPGYQYIYGPVASWRYGRSLGIDPVSAAKKTCSFDCVYCQVGKTVLLTDQRSVFVPTEALIGELQRVPPVEIDQITFAGNGEPTLAANLGEMIRGIRNIRSERIAVITNASLIWRPDVREDLALADVVIAKLDAATETMFSDVNHPAAKLTIEEICGGLRVFKKKFKGRMVLQAMFVSPNRDAAAGIAKRALSIGPDEIEVNTPLRVSPVKPLGPEEMAGITKIFREICAGIPVKTVYEEERKKSEPFCRESTERRRGKESA